MKIFQINSVYKYGSTGKIVEDLSSFLVENNNKSYIAYGRGKDYSKLESGIFKIGNKREQFRHLLATRIFDRHGFSSTESTKKLIRIIKSLNPDIIMLHNLHGYYVNIKLLFNFLSSFNKPVVWLLHDAWSMSGHSAHFEMTKNGDIPIGNTFFRQKFEYPASLIFNQSKKNYNEKKELFTSINNLTIVTPSIWLARKVEKSFFSSTNSITINNGINTNVFKIIDSKEHIIINEKVQDKKILLGVASVWTDKKGLNIFNQLADLVSEDYKIILIGISKKNKKELNRKIYPIDRTENVEELVKYYNAAYVFLNPTFEDNFPSTNIEALSCGTPVITFNTGGCAEAIDENSGIVTKYKTANSILEALEEMKMEHFKPINCRNRGEKFSLENMLYQYQTLFSNIIKGEENEV